MRFLLYNIAYGTGSPRSASHHVFTMHRYLRTPHHHFEAIRDFVIRQRPDIVGLVEVDNGSVRFGRRNQVSELARDLSHEHSWGRKYGNGAFTRYLPILRHQGNALLARGPLRQVSHHFFERGFKRLIVEVTVDDIQLYLVHLALNERIRGMQLRYLTELIGTTAQPVILAGDFNIFQGRRELAHLMKETGLRNPNTGRRPTYPSWGPRRELDLILCSPAISVRRFHIFDDILLSDHLPLLVDFAASS